MTTNKRLTDENIAVIAKQEIQNSIGAHTGGELSKDRATAMDRYLGEPMGNEQEGRSQVQARDVMDTIEWMLPKLIRMFSNYKSSIIIEPVGAEDEEQAKQETDVLNYIFFKKNSGFLILYSWFKDALLQKTGVVKRIVENVNSKTRQSHENLLEFELAALLSDNENELIERTDRKIFLPLPNDQGQLSDQEVQVSDVTIIRTEERKQITYEVIPPEEFIISYDAKTPDPHKARMTGHQTSLTSSDLTEMGFSSVDISKMHKGTSYKKYSEESIARNNKTDERNFVEGSNLNKAMVTYQVSELYMRIDRDGDGIAELLKVFISGDFVEIEPVDSNPFFAITPIILTHKFNGLSVADVVQDIQEMRTGALRSYFDNFYQTINGTTYYNQNTVNVEDLLVSAPYGIRAVDGVPANEVMHIQPNGLPPQAYQLLDVLDKLRVERVGDFQSTLDPNVLANANNGVVASLLSEASAKVEMIARIFAETGVRSLFRDLHAELIKHGHKEDSIKLREQWLPVDPQSWQDRTDFTVNVGLGIKNSQQETANLNSILSLQKELYQIDGGQGQLVTFQNIYSSSKRFAEALGETNPDLYFQDPSQAKPPPPPPPEPDVIGATLKIEGAKLEQKNQEVLLKDKQLQRQEQLDRDKAQLQVQTVVAKQEIEQVKLQIASIRTEADHLNAKGRLEIMNRAGELDEELKKMQLVFEQREAKATNEMMEYKANLDATTKILVEQIKQHEPTMQAMDTAINTKLNEIFENVQSLDDKVSAPKNKKVFRDEKGKATHIGNSLIKRDSEGNIVGLE